VKLYILISALLLTSCAATETTVVNKNIKPAQKSVIAKFEPYSIDSIITNSALASYKNKYVKAKSHKAFAQSQSGTSYWKSNRTSKKHATDSALIACQVHNKKFEDTYPCKIININGVWVTK